MNDTKILDLIGGVTLQIACLFLLLAGSPSWVLWISVFVGMWWTIGLYRNAYNYLRKTLNRNKVIES